MTTAKRIGLVGARGYVGESFLRCISSHPRFEVAWVGSRSHAGAKVHDVLGDVGHPELVFEEVSADRIPDADAVVLALPNEHSHGFIAALDASETKILDLSADHRFDDDWVYGLPELHRERLVAASAVANPGCYATASTLALDPLKNQLEGVASIFGVSGYSGAGKTPSPKNDPDRLRDNLVPYSLAGHIHEREISRQLGRPVRFMPHVAPFFRGITLTIAATLSEPTTAEALLATYRQRYDSEPLIDIGAEIPEVVAIRERESVSIGGFAIDPRDPRRIAVVATIDNLLKGAASQALQNLNLMFELDELCGLSVTEG